MRKFRLHPSTGSGSGGAIFNGLNLMVSLSNHGPHRFSASCSSTLEFNETAPLSRLFRRRGLGMSKRGGPAMAAVRGVGFSDHAVQEDVFLDRLRENKDPADELGRRFCGIAAFWHGPDCWRPVAPVAIQRLTTPLRRGRLDTPRTAQSPSISCKRQRSPHAI